MGQDKEEANKKAAREKFANEEEMANKKAWELINSQQIMKNELTKMKTSESTNNFNVQSEDIDSVLKIFKDKYSKNSDYKEPIKNSDGILTFSFPSKKEKGKTMTDAEILREATSFFTEVAKNEIKSLILDKHHNVLGYSNGDGKLYHPDGKPFEKGDTLSREAGIPLNRFDMSLIDEPNVASTSRM